MSDPGTGWHAFSPEDPNCPPHLRELANTSEPSVLGKIVVTVHDLTAGASSIHVEGPGLSTTQLIDTAITELQEARRLLAG
ncbi:hypothetical protein GCM10027586_02330 [Kineococcus gypseus]|uniref:hypothetical protein n=1 Tax=Kineococcus gypseus TaxID=1637102 RepID=UPI003D7E0991